MGADLYYQDKRTTGRKAKYQVLFDQAVKDRNIAVLAGNKAGGDALQKKVEKYYDLMYSYGYFRDSYNGSSLLWRLGLSWWTDITPLVGDSGIPSKRNLIMIHKKIMDAEFSPVDKAYCRENFMEGTVKSWNEYYVKKRANLLRFLSHAIDNNIKIRFSL